MNPYTKEEWKAYEKANKEKRNKRRRELYKLKKLSKYTNNFDIYELKFENSAYIIFSPKEK